MFNQKDIWYTILKYSSADYIRMFPFNGCPLSDERILHIVNRAESLLPLDNDGTRIPIIELPKTILDGDTIHRDELPFLHDSIQEVREMHLYESFV